MRIRSTAPLGLLTVFALLAVATEIKADAVEEGLGTVQEGECNLNMEGVCEPTEEENDHDEDNEDGIFCLDASCLQLGEEQDCFGGDEFATVREGAQCEVLANESREYIFKLATSTDTPDDLRDVLPRCHNEDELCTMWAVQGRCDGIDRYHEWVEDMQTTCALACQSCHMLIVLEEEEEEEEHGYSLNLGRDQDCEVDGEDVTEEMSAKCMEMDKEARDYIYELDRSDETPEDIRHLLPRCTNRFKQCTMWAVQGRCEGDRYHDYVDDMQTDCSLACQSCDQLLYENRCPLDPDAPNAWEPGDLNEFFENITVQEKYVKWKPKVWSRPTLAPGDTEETADYQLGPWIVTMEDVFNDEESQRLIDIGSRRGYERSDDWGEYLPDGTYQTYYHEGRTSHHTWCGYDCHRDELALGLLERIEEITNIPSLNYETFQLLRYELGQKYETHHDYDGPDFRRQQGVRIMTVFLYLSDVEEGGGTNFPHLNLTFTPKRGRVVIWPNVLDEDPHQWDDRTEHQALPVIKGVKYAANSWIHQRDVQGTMARNCYQ